jgi:uridine kinase
MPSRQDLLAQLADRILHLPADHVRRIGIDGVDAAGKTTFADALGHTLAAKGARVIRASVDGFHNPRALRYRLGRWSPEGFYRESYDYPRLKRLLLDPLSPGGSGWYVTAAFDHATDSPVSLAERQAQHGDILIFDGIFLHRPELRGYWDFSVFLDVSFAVSVPRLAARDGGSYDPDTPQNRRYVGGQKIYLRECEPRKQATVVINNDDVAAPRVID